MTQAGAVLQLVGGFVVLIGGAEVLVRAASKLGIRLGMSPITVGATIVAFGTSAPEFVVSMSAAVGGEADLALGNVLGSNIANIALVLGLAALVRPIPVDPRVLKLEYVVALAATASIPFIVSDLEVTRVEGAGLAAGFLCFLLIYVARSRAGRAGATDRLDAPAPERGGLARLILFGVLGLGALIFGSRLVVDSATWFADEYQWGGAVVGATLLALGTSLPEIATSMVAAVRGAHGIAIGNVLGSNIFNLLLVLGSVSAVQPLVADPLQRDRLTWLMLGLTVGLFPILRFGKRVSRLEGVLLLAGYGGLSWMMVEAVK